MRNASFYSIGIDPGRNGGIVILSPERKIAASTKMPETELAIWFWLRFEMREIRNSGEELTVKKFKACIEKVGGYVPRDRSGKKGKDRGDRGSHMFVFGRTYGALTMALVVLDLYPYMEPPPRKWQADLGISPRTDDESDSQWKNRLKEKAQELFPNDKITLNICDASLLAYWLSMR